MACKKMHAGERMTGVLPMRRLPESQFPEWAGLRLEALEALEALGAVRTDNPMDRIGDHWRRPCTTDLPSGFTVTCTT
jgi:hypothetical protein